MKYSQASLGPQGLKTLVTSRQLPVYEQRQSWILNPAQGRETS